jgi:hypothetical protein
MGCDINNQTKIGKRTVLSKACYLGYIDIATFLIGCPGIMLELEDAKQRTALHNAAFGPGGRREDPYLGVNEKDSPECT